MLKELILLTWLLAPPSFGEFSRGSLVVSIVSKRGDYVVVAAESRNVDPITKQGDDSACKIVALGTDTLFFETGVLDIKVRQGEPWDAVALAHAVYQQSKHRDADGLSLAWGERAVSWFRQQPDSDLKAVADPDGGIVTGGFANFAKNGGLSVEGRTVVYSTESHMVEPKPFNSGESGQIEGYGLDQELVQEFFDGRTLRGVQAFGPIGAPRLIAMDPGLDAEVAGKAIQFAIDNATGKDKKLLGGPIDVAILRKDAQVEWRQRKSECFQKDLAPTGQK
jgi:hypothetical protein